MGETTVVGPGLTPDWLKKRKGVMGAIEDQLTLGVELPGKGLTLDQLQAVVEHRNPFTGLGQLEPKFVVPVHGVKVGDASVDMTMVFFEREGPTKLSDLRKFGRKSGYGRRSINGEELRSLWPACLNVVNALGMGAQRILSLDEKIGPKGFVIESIWSWSTVPYVVTVEVTQNQLILEKGANYWVGYTNHE